MVLVKVPEDLRGPLATKNIILDDRHQLAENHTDIGRNNDLQNREMNYYLERMDQHVIVVAGTNGGAFKENALDKVGDKQNE